MKLYVQNKASGARTYLKQNANSRQQLASQLGSERFKVKNQTYSVNDVRAEQNDNTANAMAAGGVIGIAGGVPGVIIGGIIGALLGKSTDDEDNKKVEKFNRSLL